MEIRINRNRTDPPARDYARRDTEEAIEERLAASTALESLDTGQSIEFIGEGATRDRVNSLINTLYRLKHPSRFTTAKIPGGIGVWRTS